VYSRNLWRVTCCFGLRIYVEKRSFWNLNSSSVSYSVSISKFPTEFFSKSRPDSLFKESTTVIQGNLYNRLIMTKHLIVPGLLKYSTKEVGYEGRFINWSALSHIFPTDDENLWYSTHSSLRRAAIGGATFFIREN